MLKFGDKETYRVVGLFTAGGSAAESEVWADLKDVERNTGRDGLRLLRPAPRGQPADLDELKKTIDDDTQFKLAAMPEADYFAEPVADRASSSRRRAP